MREFTFSDDALLGPGQFWSKTVTQGVLAVGLPEQWKKISEVAGQGTQLMAVQFDELSREADKLDAYDAIVSLVIFGRDDCIDLATELNRLNYEGRYVIIAESIPNPRVLLAELHGSCPGLAIELVPD